MIVTKDIEKMLKEDGFCVSGITGVSMLPMLRQGEDRVLLVQPSFPLERNAVALYRHEEAYVLHRVIGYQNGTYIIRGDNCIGKEYVRETQIIGILAGFWRGETYYECTEEMNRKFAKHAARTWLWRRWKAAISRGK